MYSSIYKPPLYEFDTVRSSDRTHHATETAAFCRMYLNDVFLSLVSLIRLLHELLLFVIFQCLINVQLLLVLKPGVINAAADLP